MRNLGIKQVEERVKAASGIDVLVHVVHQGARRRWVIETDDKTDLEILLRTLERAKPEAKPEKP